MKKQLKIIVVVICCFLTLKLYSQTSEDSAIYSKQNVALIDAVIRSIDEEYYVKEIFYKDFNGSMSLPNVVDYEGTILIDNGLGFDENAGDGVYTSVNKYSHSEKTPYRADTLIKSVLEESHVDSSFQHNESLNTFLDSYKVPGFAGKIKISIACDAYICSCTVCSCSTCWTVIHFPGGTPVVVSHCLKVKNCRIEIEW